MFKKKPDLPPRPPAPQMHQIVDDLENAPLDDPVFAASANGRSSFRARPEELSRRRRRENIEEANAEVLRWQKRLEEAQRKLDAKRKERELKRSPTIPESIEGGSEKNEEQISRAPELRDGAKDITFAIAQDFMDKTHHLKELETSLIRQKTGLEENCKELKNMGQMIKRQSLQALQLNVCCNTE